jgi:hypothetical protein
MNTCDNTNMINYAYVDNNTMPIISWMHIEIEVINKNLDMIKYFYSLMPVKYSSLKNLEVNQLNAIESIIKNAIYLFDIDIIEYLNSIGLDILNNIEKYSKIVLMTNNKDALDFYSIIFENSDFIHCLLNGYYNTLEWLENNQYDICYISNPNIFFDYPNNYKVYDLINNQNVKGLQYYFKYISLHIDSKYINNILNYAKSFINRDNMSDIIEIITIEQMCKMTL